MPIYFAITPKSGSPIKGDVPADNKEHAGKIEAQHFSFEVSHSRSGVPGTREFLDATPVRTTSFVIWKLPDSASPDLFFTCAQGMEIKELQLIVTKTVGGKQVATEVYTLTDAVIATIKTSSEAANGGRTEILYVNYAEIEIQHTTLDQKPVKQKINFRSKP